MLPSLYRNFLRKMCKHNSWSELYQFRRAAAARFGTIFKLPLAKRARDVLLRHVADGMTVLEIGAGDRAMRGVLSSARKNIEYKSMDIDPAGAHDYRSLEDIERTFDCVFAFEVIEHLRFEEIHDWLRQLAQRLAPGGKLLLSTPNTFYPPAYLRDATHRTPLCYDELAGLVEASGLRVRQIYRIYNDPVHRVLLRRYLFAWLFRLLGIDYAKQIVVVAEKP